MTNSNMREEFESWWTSEVNIEVFDLHRCEFPMQKPEFVQPYACHDTQRAWLSWNASREALEIELPYPADDYEYADIQVDGACKHYRAAKEAIESAGVKVKS